MQERHLRPWELDLLTLSEIVILLEEDNRGASEGFASQEEIIEYARWWRSLTPRQRLEQAR
jgi:hypothetical protein